MIANPLEMPMIRLCLFAILLPLLTACKQFGSVDAVHAADRGLPTADRWIAITLDDAPLGPGARGDWDRAGVLIDGLEAAEVQAAFFVMTDGFAKLHVAVRVSSAMARPAI